MFARSSHKPKKVKVNNVDEFSNRRKEEEDANGEQEGRKKKLNRLRSEKHRRKIAAEDACDPYKILERSNLCWEYFCLNVRMNRLDSICEICSRLRNQLELKKLTVQQKADLRKISDEYLERKAKNVCKTCRLEISKGSIKGRDRVLRSTSSKLPENLSSFKLDQVCENMISLRLPFEKVRKLRLLKSNSGREYLLQQAVCMLSFQDTICKKLPRSITNDSSILDLGEVAPLKVSYLAFSSEYIARHLLRSKR